MKTITIKLNKKVIHDFVDVSTFKNVDALHDADSARVQNAIASDSGESNDAFLITEYCDRWDARIRGRMKFCLIDDSEEEILEFSNIPDDTEDTYEYKLSVEDSFNANDVRSVGKLLDEYIKRGAIYDWYVGMGLKPTSDTELSLQTLEDEAVRILRGQAWGRRPMQPFGPAFFNYSKPLF